MLRSRSDSGGKRVNGGAALFQLLDWNRGARRRKKPCSSSVSSSAPPPPDGDVKNRLATSDDKVPLAKLLQIVDENYGGFRGRKDQPLGYQPPPTDRGYASSGVSIAAADMKDERLRAAGLVARLMGLEFLPNMPPHSNPSEPPLRPDQELLLKRVSKPGLKERYPDLPARPHPLKRQCRESILFSKPRQQQPHHRDDSSHHGSSSTQCCATKHSSMSPRSPRRDVDGISNLPFRKCSRPVGRHLKPFSSSYDNVDYEGSPLKHNSSRQRHGLCKDKNLSSCPAANDNMSNEKQKPLNYLESNWLLSKSSCQVDCNGKSSVGDNYPARINLKQNNSLHGGERMILAESYLCELQQSGCDSKTNARMSNGDGNVGVKLERPVLKKKATHIRRLNNGYQVEHNCSRLHKDSRTQNDAIAAKCTGHTSSPIDFKCLPGVSMEHTVEESSATYDVELANDSVEKSTTNKDPSGSLSVSDKGKIDSMLLTDGVRNSRAGQMQMRGSLTLMKDDLGALLVHKVNELNFVDKDKRDRSSADILEELISAMTEGESISHYNQFGETHKSFYPVHELEKLQANLIGFNIYSRQEGYLHPSPLSILETSFSTESSVGESISVTSGKDDHSGTTCCSCNDVSNDCDIDLLDSASSSSVSFNSGKISHLLKGLLIMYKTNLCTLHESEPCCVTEIISNVELILEDNRSCQKYEKEETVMESLILDSLENLVNACTNPAFNLISAKAVDKSLLRRFLFDCILEHLSLNYNYCFLSIYKGLVKVPLILNCGRLSNEVLRKMQHWTNLAGSIEVDSCFPLQRTDFEAECCVVGLEMEQHTTETLINEMLFDILSDWIGCQSVCTARG